METTATLNPILTDFAQTFMRDQAGFVADILCPYFAAPLQAAQYYLFGQNDIAQVPLLNGRAPGAVYPRLQTTLSSDSYFCEDYGLEAPAPDEERKKYGAYFDLDKLKVNRIIDTIRVNREQRVVTLVSAASSANIAIPWNDPTSNPKGDVDAAREIIRQQTGLRANTLVISEPCFLTLQENPRMLDVFKFTQTGLLNEDKLASYFGLKTVAVARNVNATNNEGQVFTPSDIWGNQAFLCVVNDNSDLETPTWSRTFHWTAFSSQVTLDTGGTGPAMTAGGGGPEVINIFTYRDETVKSDIHRAEHYLTEKVIASGAGYLLNNPLH